MATDQTIWKFQLADNKRQTLQMPTGAQILSLQTQYNTPYLWALVDPNAEKEERIFETIGTGWEIKPGTGMIFIGTYQLDNGAYVFHVFELIS